MGCKRRRRRNLETLGARTKSRRGRNVEGRGCQRWSRAALGSDAHRRAGRFVARRTRRCRCRARRPAMIAIGGGSLAVLAGYLAAAARACRTTAHTLVWVAVAVSASRSRAVRGCQQVAGTPRPGARGRSRCCGFCACCSPRASRVAFTVGWLFVGLAVPLVSLRDARVLDGGSRFSRSERRLLLASSVLVAVCWGYLALTSRQPTLLMPLAKCDAGLPAQRPVRRLAAARARDDRARRPAPRMADGGVRRRRVHRPALQGGG